jgi:hypothetical protein
MQKTRITISNILKNQLPNFVKEDYPLVEELFSEYYRGQEYQGGILDIFQNIDQYIKLNNLTNLISETQLTSDISFFDTTISVDSTSGFPDNYGLIKIDSEIILYKSKTSNSFVGCIRGFSGISSYEEGLTFEQTVAQDHTKLSLVKNLNILFLNEFLLKIKKQFAPGFENRKFFSKSYTTVVNGQEKVVKQNINENIFIKQLKDFYSSKGTDDSFKILFKSLFGDDVTVIRPRDFLIRPSDSQYRVNKELVIESIEGDPLDLIDTTIFQNPLIINDKEFISFAYGTVNKVETISRKDKIYYVISLDFDYNKDINLRGSTFGEFVIGPKTLITDTTFSESNVITVDSTYGFPETNGLIRIVFSDGTELKLKYKTKNLNQFLGCEGIDRDILEGQEVYLDYYCVGGNTVSGDENPIKFRVTGVLSEAITPSNSHYIVEGNRINLRTLGKDIQEQSFNNWKFNICPSYKVKTIIQNDTFSNTYLITLHDEHIFFPGDKAKIISSRPQLQPGTIDSGISEFSANILSVQGKYSFTCSVDFVLDTSISYEIERKINKFNFSYNSTTPDSEYNNVYITDVQNTYRDSSGSLYVASQSLPTYKNQTLIINDNTIVLSDQVYINKNEINVNNPQITDSILYIGNHSFKTGDAVYYQSGSGINNLNISEGIYYVKSIGTASNSTEIKLASSRTNIDNNIFLDLDLNVPQLSGTDNKLFKSTNEIIFFQNSVKNSSSTSKFERVISPKNLIRKISKPIETKDKKLTSPGQIGILVNGVEILNYKSNDFVYYGPIQEIKIKKNGSDYDVITPPKLQISDKNGIGCSAVCHITGSLDRIDVLDGGFDYEGIPSIEISGGNGSGAQATANMTVFEHSISFSAKDNTQVDLTTNSITFNIKHKFYNSEPVKYDYTQIPIEGLMRDVVYYVGVQSDYVIKLYGSVQDSFNKVNPIDLISYSPGSHSIISVEKKNTIGTVSIVKSGTGYSNRKTTALPQNINIFSNSIKINKHGYKTGETLIYSTTGSPIVGISTNSKYFIYTVNENEFKLCQIGNESVGEDFYLKTSQFIDLTDPGTGIHSFNYTPISVKILGNFKNKSLNTSEIDAKIIPAFRGSIESIFIENGGVGYGSSDIINYNRQPNFELQNGSGAELRPIISNGKISEVLIVNSGSNYNALPLIEVVGSGTGAKLIPIISDGKIQDVKIVSSGINYNSNGTILNVVSAGSGVDFEFSIQNWNINQVERSIQGRSILSNDVFLNDTRNEYRERITQITHCYAPRKLRESLIVSREEGGRIVYTEDLTLNSSNVENSISLAHSPIIGWSYDGNPIYGPFGYTNPDGSGLIKKIKSGYILNANKSNRPSLDIFPPGFFVEDYDYVGNGDLDEFNGRFCSTPEFPNGIYAYFATFGDISEQFSRNYLRPAFPYLIGNYYKSLPIEFNFDIDESQNSIVFENLNIIRNTKPYGLISKNSNYNYVFNPIEYEEQLNKVTRVGSGKIDNIVVISGGENYKVGDKITLSEDEYGNKSYAEVTKINGVKVSSISALSNEIPDVEFGSSRDLKTIVGVALTPHNLKDQDVINIIGLNKIFTNSEKNVSSRINVFTNQLILKKNVPDYSITGLVTSFEVDGNLNEYAIKPNDVYLMGNEEVTVLNVNKSTSSIRVKRQVGISSYFQGFVLTEKPRRFEISTIESSSPVFLDEKYFQVNKEIYFNPLESVGLGTVGITTTIFVNIIPLNYQVSISTGAKTGLIFNNPQNTSSFKIGDYINLIGSSDFDFNSIQNSKVINVGINSITVDYDSSSLSGVGVTSFVTKWQTRDIPIGSIYLPDHNLKTGDKVRYFSNGTSIGISTDKITSSLLIDNQLLYVYKFDDDHIGIGKTIVGLTTTEVYPVNYKTGETLLHFTSPGSGVYHRFKTDYDDVQVGTVVKNIARVSTTKNSSLFFNENVEVDVTSNVNRTIVVKYNKQNRRLVVNPKDFISINLDSSISIENHQYLTGDKVIHTTELDESSTDLIKNQIYYVVVLDPNTIKLSNSYYEATLQNPVTVDINITTSYGQLSLVNPPIKLYRNETIKFDLTDKSLSFINNEISYSAFKFNIYKDSNFTERFTKDEEDSIFSVRKFGRIGISNDAAVEIRVSKKTPSKLYYRFELDNVNYNIPNNQLEYYVDDENIENNSTLFVLNSAYSGKYKINNVGNNFFEYLLKEKPEKSSYSTTEATLSYLTDSYSTLGEIVDVKVLSKDRKYRVLPGITSISSKTGSGSILFPFSDNIGSAQKVKIENIGFDYSSDYSLRPTGNLPQIINVEPLSIFKDIKVTSIGKNYTITPNLIVLDGLTKVQDKQAELKFVPEESLVEIIQNSSGLYNKIPYIIPINNSNGITAKSASFNPDNKTLTLVINASFVVNDPNELPFIENERVLLENFKVSSVFVDENGEVQDATNVKGINSENYEYALFELMTVNDSTLGGVTIISSIVIDLSSYLEGDEIPGNYVPINSFGYIVPEKYFPTFDITLQKNNFILGEEVVTTSGYSGIVEYWDRENEFVSVLADDKFVSGDKIIGKTSNLSGIVGKVEFFDSEYSTNSYSVVQRGWDTNIGFLNDNTQRIHDSDYYQYFSYALKSKTQISEWNDPVSSLNHTVGFKKFATLDVESKTPKAGITTVSYSELNSVSDFFEIIDLNSYHDFDMVFENTFLLGNRIVSDQIIFDTKEVQDYSESIGNRVLMIDDFSSQFNNLPRQERYSVIDRFPIYQHRHRKYFAYVKDKLFFNERQFSIISLIHNNTTGFVNQYGKLQTVNELGTFDFVINGDEGQVQFKPFDYEFNDFDVDLVAYSLFDTFIGLGNTTTAQYNIGSIANISNEVSVLPINSTNTVTIAKINTQYRSSKVILTINSKDGQYRESTELNIVHDGIDAYATEYGKLFTKNINPPVGLSTYNVYLDGPNINIDLIPYVGYGSTVEINTLKISVRDETASTPGVISENNIKLETGFANIPASSSPVATPIHNYSIDYGGGYYYISIQDNSSLKYQSLELITLNNQTDVYQTQFGSIITDNSLVGLGTFGTQIIGNQVYVSFTPTPNKNFTVRFYYNGIKTITEEDIPPSEVVLNLNEAQIVSFNSDYIGTENAIKRSFDLYHKKLPIMRRTFRGNSSSSVDLSKDRIIIPNHYFSTGEEVIYDSGSDEPIGIATTTIVGVGLTDKLPSKLYIVKVNDISVRVSGSASEALKAFPEYLNLTSYGVGSQHSFTGKRGNSRSLITIDNMIQSPIVSTSTTTTIASEVLLKDIRVKVDDPSVFIGGDIFKVNDEIIRVKVVGFGSTNTLLVNRYWMGTLPGVHTTGTLCTKIKGDYNIVGNKINFYDAPYGKVPVVPENPRPDEVDYVGITTYSSFSGRIFNKSGTTNSSSTTYSDNILFDDISNEFTGLATVFALKENSIPVSGVSTSNLFVLIKDILQIPNNEARDNNGAFELGLNPIGETAIIFNQENNITNISDINITNIPSGGIIVSIGSSFGSGYQPLRSADASVEIDNLGEISNISVGSTGSGYRVSDGKQIIVSVASTVGLGTNIIPIEEERSLFAKLNFATEKICNIGIGTTLHSVSIINYDPIASNITISKNTDVVIPKSTLISVFLNNLTSELVDIGIRTESNTDYNPYYIGFTTVINGSISKNLNLVNSGVAFTSFYDKFYTKTKTSISSGSTTFYLNTIDNISLGDYIFVNSSLPLKVVGIGNSFVNTQSSLAFSVPESENILVRRYTLPEIVFDSPKGYSDIPLIYSTSSGSSGIGTGAKIKIDVGESGSIIDFTIENNGYGYKKSDILTIPTDSISGIPLDSSLPFSEFKIFVDSVYNTKFSAWSIGDLQVIDNFDHLFDNNRKIFPIKIGEKPRSIRSKKGSTLDVQSTLIVLYNDILQVPGEGYIFKGGSIIYFPEAPKYEDRVSIIFYRGNEEVDVIDVDVLETVKIGDGLRITSDQKRYNEDERIVTDIVSSDYVNTNPYSDRGISDDFNFLRPVAWSKQNIDLVIDGVDIGKDRIYYEPNIYPSTKVIQDIGIGSTEIYVESIKTFFDNDAEEINDKERYIIKIVNQEALNVAIATCSVSGGSVSSVGVFSGGSGYKQIPNVSIQNPTTNSGFAYTMSISSIFNSSGIPVTGLTSAILGEQLVGAESESTAFLLDKVSDNIISYLPLNSSIFVENEEIRFELSGLSAQVQSTEYLKSAIGIASLTDGVVTGINIVNAGYGYTYGPIQNLEIISNGSGYPDTLNPSNSIFYNARLNSITGSGIDAAANISLNIDPFTLKYVFDTFEITNSGGGYSVGDILEVKSFDNIGIGATNRNKTLTTPIRLKVTEIKAPLVIVDPPTPDVEIIKGVNFVGDFGVIVGITTAIVGVSSNALIFDLYIPENSYLRDTKIIGDTVVGSSVTVSQLKPKDYFVVSNSNIGNGVQTLRNDGTILGLSTDYINNVYQVFSSQTSTKYINVSGIQTAYVNTITTIVESFDPEILNISSYNSIYGNYSWGKIANLDSRNNPLTFKTYQDVSPGITLNPIIQRFNPLKFTDYNY